MFMTGLLNGLRFERISSRVESEQVHDRHAQCAKIRTEQVPSRVETAMLSQMQHFKFRPMSLFDLENVIFRVIFHGNQVT